MLGETGTVLEAFAAVQTHAIRVAGIPMSLLFGLCVKHTRASFRASVLARQPLAEILGPRMPFRLMVFVCAEAVEPLTTNLARVGQSVPDVFDPILRVGALHPPAFGSRVKPGHAVKVIVLRFLLIVLVYHECRSRPVGVRLLTFRDVLVVAEDVLVVAPRVRERVVAPSNEAIELDSFTQPFVRQLEGLRFLRFERREGLAPGPSTLDAAMQLQLPQL